MMGHLLLVLGELSKINISSFADKEATVFLRLFPLFARSEFESMHQGFADTAANVLRHFSHRDYKAFVTFFQDMLLLVKGRFNPPPFLCIP